MKQGVELMELSQELMRQKSEARDFMADSDAITMQCNGGTTLILQGDEYVPNDLCHEQIAAKLNIPLPYYKRMREEAPELLEGNVNHWLRSKCNRYMLRTLGGTARALLGKSFRPLDNVDLAQVILPVLNGAGAEVKSCAITERRLYIKAVTAKLEGEISVGDVVQAGIVISNSEVGCGSLAVEQMIYTLSCKNGMVTGSVFRKRHIGRRWDLGDDNVGELISDSTRRLDDAALWSKVKDVATATMNEEFFQQTLNRLRGAKEDTFQLRNVQKVEEVTRKTFGLSTHESNSALEHLARGGDFSRLGMANAITRASQDVKSYDRATDLERLGGRVIEMPKNEWEGIVRQFGKN